MQNVMRFVMMRLVNFEGSNYTIYHIYIRISSLFLKHTRVDSTKLMVIHFADYSTCFRPDKRCRIVKLTRRYLLSR